MSLFLNPKNPIITCSAADCLDCPVQQDVMCHFDGGQLARFLLFSLPVFIVCGAALMRRSAWLLLPWLAIILAYFFVLENRVMCSHCPHYAEEESGTLKCWANYGVPKIWPYRPGPMTSAENILFFVGLAAVFLLPVYTMVLDTQWLLLALFVLTLAGFGLAMSKTMCSHCMNFACPLNMVDEAARRAFFERNPVIARAWQTDIRRN